MKTHHETDVERVMKLALAREAMEERRRTPKKGGIREVRLGMSSVNPPANALPTPIVAPLTAPFAIETILVPTDFSPLSERAVTYAHRFAGQFGAQLILLHVVEPVSYAPPHCLAEGVAESTAAARKAAEEGLARLARKLLISPAGTEVSYRPMIVEGDAARETDRVARECEVDLIVIATHGYTGLNHLLLGGTAEKVVRRAPCPVLVVREKERDFVSVEPAMVSDRAANLGLV
jgi:nucleotide-binding universal stress UspA family protein